jgi:hypothetical protein
MSKPDCEMSHIGLCSEELAEARKWTAAHAKSCDKIPKISMEDIFEGRAGIAPSYWWEVVIRLNTIGNDAKVRCCYCDAAHDLYHDHD